MIDIKIQTIKYIKRYNYMNNKNKHYNYICSMIEMVVIYSKNQI